MFNNKNSNFCFAFFHLFESTAQDVDAVIGIVDSAFKGMEILLGTKTLT